jgi:hypothetical protein
VDKTEKLSGQQSLRLSFDGKHDPNLEAACIVVIVQPSTTYGFSGWIKTKEITSDQGVGFRIRSLEGPPVVANTRDVLGSSPWEVVEQTWSSRPDVHRAQICVIRDASENSDLRISGTAWIDDVNLLPQAAEHRKP